MIKRRIILNLLVLIISFLLFYAFLPALNFKNIGFYFYIFIVIILFIIANSIFTGMNDGESNYKISKYLSKIILILVLIIISGGISSFVLFRAKDYSKIISLKEGDFSKDVERVDFDKIPSVDRDTARRLGLRKMGEVGDLVSQYDIDDTYSQVNIKGKPVRVSSLKYANIFKWFKNFKQGIPYYISVDMVSQKAELNKLSKPMKYSLSDKFSRNIYRHLRFTHPTYIYDEVNLEIDDQGKPFWVAPVLKPKVGLFGGFDSIGVVIVDASTGEVSDYSADEVPEWIDRVYSADLIIDQLNYNGKYKNGYINSKLNQVGVTVPTEGYNYLSLGKDIYLYTGITSVTADQSNIGFVLVNMRTKDTKFYPLSSAEEFSVMESASGTVQEKNYNATFPILININDRATYFMSLKDNAGLTKMYALVDAESYQKVAVGNTIPEAVSRYSKFNNQIDIRNSETVKEEIIISDIKPVVIDGTTNFIIKAEDKEKLYIAPVNISRDLVFLKTGDSIKVKSVEGRDEINILSLE
ncbi:MAG: hypothetical protein Q4P31_04875 [Andreesenia angusta]|nr:hypothetical protein [Andreesenia angusta]